SQASRRSLLTFLQPGYARFATLPGAGRKTQNLDLDPATLQRASQNIDAAGSDGDRAPAHRARIIDEQRHYRIAELGVLLAFEGERLPRIDDDARKPHRIEDALVQIELQGPALLR